MAKAKDIFIKQLDIGYVVTVDNKNKAVEDSSTLRKYLDSIFKELTDDAASQYNYTIRIEVDGNVPTAE